MDDENLAGKIPIIFGNFKSIYKKSVDFLKDLKQRKDDCYLIAQTFVDHVSGNV